MAYKPVMCLIHHPMSQVYIARVQEYCSVYILPIEKPIAEGITQGGIYQLGKHHIEGGGLTDGRRF